MKNVLTLLLIFLPFTLPARITKTSKREVQAVISRSFQNFKGNIELQEIDPENGCDVFEQEIKNNRLILKGSSEIALTRGFYDFLRTNELGINSWSGTRIEWPQSLDGLKTRRVVSPVKHHYYYNVVTYGYSTPYWDWSRWEKEIDWMALHGIDMPLALVANEAISVRVWKKLGLTEKEISEYLVGPAHFPWMRMGNISGIDSPLPYKWHDEQVKLQHKILNRMKKLGMSPICPGFAGFVPKAIQRLYPDLKIVETSWNVFHNWMVSPQEELFAEIGKMFIEEWENEFGKNGHYIVDSFNEMDVPFPPKGTEERYHLLSSYGDKVYGSIKAGNPDAVWVMQGWMFGYQRHIWDYETLEALVKNVPDEKMILLDLAVDYNANFWKSTLNWEFYRGFFNKKWVYSVIPNMGGKCGFTGILDFYANGHLKALKSPNRGNLHAIGMAPEGIENNEVLYELMTDAGWSSSHIDLNEWLASYTKSRYGAYNTHFESYWKEMLNSVYGTFTDHPRFNWQLRPGLTQRGTICLNESFFKAFEHFAENAETLKGNTLFEADLRENMAMYLGGKLEILVQAISGAYLNNNEEQYDSLVADFERVALTIDRLLADHPILNLERWIGFARNHGDTPTEKAYYEKNARRIVTIWGPPVDDYSARIWSGLIRDYYLPRWMQYFADQKKGVPFEIAEWEKEWVEQRQGTSPVEKSASLSGEAMRELAASVLHISPSMLPKEENILKSWSAFDFNESKAVLKATLSIDDLKKMKGIRISHLKGKERIRITEVALRMDGNEVKRVFPPDAYVGTDSRHHFEMLQIDSSLSGNNGCELLIILQAEQEVNNNQGKVVLLQ